MDSPPEVRKLDFSEFHPLDHSVFTCAYPGGRRRHLAYQWEFRWRNRLLRRVLCPFGKHHWVQWWKGREKAGVSCLRCYKDKPEELWK